MVVVLPPIPPPIPSISHPPLLLSNLPFCAQHKTDNYMTSCSAVLCISDPKMATLWQHTMHTTKYHFTTAAINTSTCWPNPGQRNANWLMGNPCPTHVKILQLFWPSSNLLNCTQHYSELGFPLQCMHQKHFHFAIFNSDNTKKLLPRKLTLMFGNIAFQQ